MDYGKLKEPLGVEIFTLTAVLEFIALIVASVFIQLATPTSFAETVAVLVPGTNSTAPATPAPDQEFSPFDPLSFVWLFVRMVIFFAAVTIFGLKALPHVMHFIRSRLKVREIYFGVIMGIILLVAYFAELSGVHGAIGALLLGVLFSQLPKRDYEDVTKGLHSIAHGVFIPIFFAGIGIYFSFGFLDLPYYLIAAVLAVVTIGKFGGAILAAMVAKLKPILTVGTGVMAKGAVDLAILLSLLSAGIIMPDLFSLVVFGIVIMILATSISLKRRLVLASAAPGEVAKRMSTETAEDALTPLYTRTVLGELRVKDVYTTSPPIVQGEMSVRQFADAHKGQYSPAYIAVTNDNSYLGIVTPAHFRKVRMESWDKMLVKDIAMQHVRAVRLGEPLYEVVEYMALHDIDLLAVLSDDESVVVGGVVHKDILQYISKT
jgi:Kef-type K+ transport system membrane component KefB